MKYWKNELVNEWMNELMNEWMNEWVNEWMSGWMNEWMNQRMNARTVVTLSITTKFQYVQYLLVSLQIGVSIA